MPIHLKSRSEVSILHLSARSPSSLNGNLDRSGGTIPGRIAFVSVDAGDMVCHISLAFPLIAMPILIRAEAVPVQRRGGFTFL